MRLLGREGPTGRLQRREQNPYAASGEAGGWELTAHHIIAHSKLVDALARLDPAQQQQVLTQAIPDGLDARMLENAGLKLPEGQNGPQYVAEAKDRLRDPVDQGVMHGARLADIRQSFFEWQGGNQFLGPNTSIRAEPSSAKDAMDTDARFMGVENYGQLKTLGDQLYGHLAPSSEATSDDVLQTLLAILQVTRETRPSDFDPSQWHELTSLREVEELAAGDLLGRQHLTKYAFFKFGINDVDQHYDQIRPTNAGRSEFTFAGVEMPATVKGTSGFIPLEDAKTVAPTQEVKRPLAQVLRDLGVPVTRSNDGTASFTLGERQLAFVAKDFLRLEGVKGRVPYRSKQDTTFTVDTQQLQDELTQEVPGESLYKYCEQMGMPTSSYLPKQLYDLLRDQRRLPNLQESLVRARIDIEKFQNEVNRLSGRDLRSETDRTRKRNGKRLSLYQRKLERAIAYEASLRGDIVRIRAAKAQLKA
ncbi:MAG: hypothetical protein M0R75_09055 [Dehalococcoidia bacterium]|nr:hypothetical protein [Dehalococcoidia bacterium]